MFFLEKSLFSVSGSEAKVSRAFIDYRSQSSATASRHVKVCTSRPSHVHQITPGQTAAAAVLVASAALAAVSVLSCDVVLLG